MPRRDSIILAQKLLIGRAVKTMPFEGKRRPAGGLQLRGARRRYHIRRWAPPKRTC